MKKNSYDNFFRNFSSRSKFGIIMALREGPKNVSEITHSTGDEQSAVSHNLSQMSACRILKVEQKGKQRVYSLNEDTVVPILDIVGKHVRKHCMGGCPR